MRLLKCIANGSGHLNIDISPPGFPLLEKNENFTKNQGIVFLLKFCMTSPGITMVQWFLTVAALEFQGCIFKVSVSFWSGKTASGQGKVREFHLPKRVGTLSP